MIRTGVIAAIVAVGLAGCGAQGDPVRPGTSTQAAVPTRPGPTMNAGVGIGANGVSPGVTLADGIGRLSLGPGGVRLGAAGIPMNLGL